MRDQIMFASVGLVLIVWDCPWRVAEFGRTACTAFGPLRRLPTSRCGMTRTHSADET